MGRTLGSCLIVACLAAVSHAAEPPVRASYIGSRNGKPPLRSYMVRLTLENKRDIPVWFVLPYWGDKPLQEKGLFPNKGMDGTPFGGKKFDGQGGPAVEVLMYGGEGFKAFRLPPKGQLELAGYTIEAWKDTSEIVVQEASELRVNGKTPLEKWLPYGVTSGKNVKVGLDIDWINLDWDAEKSASRTDYPKEKVKEVKAELLRSWKVKFKQQDAK